MHNFVFAEYTILIKKQNKTVNLREVLVSSKQMLKCSIEQKKPNV